MQIKTILNRVQKFKSFVHGSVRWGGNKVFFVYAPRRGDCPACGIRYLMLAYQIDGHCKRRLWIGEKRTISTLPMIAARLATRKRSGKYAQHPLTHRLTGQNFVHQQGGAFGHAPCPVAGAEVAAFTVKGDEVFGMTGVTMHSQKTVFKATAFQVFIKFLRVER